MTKNKVQSAQPAKTAKTQNVTIENLVSEYIIGGKEAVTEAMKENSVPSAAELTFSDLKMDSLDVVQLAVKVQDDFGIKLSDDEFAKVPQDGGENGEITFKPVDKVTLGDITNIINTKLVQK